MAVYKLQNPLCLIRGPHTCTIPDHDPTHDPRGELRLAWMKRVLLLVPVGCGPRLHRYDTSAIRWRRCHPNYSRRLTLPSTFLLSTVLSLRRDTKPAHFMKTLLTVFVHLLRFIIKINSLAVNLILISKIYGVQNFWAID